MKSSISFKVCTSIVFNFQLDRRSVDIGLITCLFTVFSLSVFQLHVVHYNSDKYKSFKEARDKPDGLAVLAFFYEVLSALNTFFKNKHSMYPPLLCSCDWLYTKTTK